MAEFAPLLGLLPLVAIAVGATVIKLRHHYANQPKRPLTLAEEYERDRAINAKYKPTVRP